jgi:hypothetical protein
MVRQTYPLAMCMGCAWRTESATADDATGHEDRTGHRVVFWDGPTSILPRSAWGSVAVWTR